MSISFFENTKNTPPSKSLTKAVTLVSKKDRALDLGSGAFRDSYFLVEKGFVVDAVDKDEDADKYLKVEYKRPEKINFYKTTFTDFSFTPNVYDLINAQNSLSFNSPESFYTVFENITNSLKAGGILVGNLFGKNDEWKERKDMTFFSEKEVLELLKAYDLENFLEQEGEGTLASGQKKYWHFFNILARKK